MKFVHWFFDLDNDGDVDNADWFILTRGGLTACVLMLVVLGLFALVKAV
jgi:hypothetical protein